MTELRGDRVVLPVTIVPPEEQRLAQLDVARQALQTARTLPEVKEIRDKAVAIKHYAKQRRYSL